jgi:hypothetical protein
MALRARKDRIVYLLTTGQVAEPALRVGNRRVFTIADIQSLSEEIQAQAAVSGSHVEDEALKQGSHQGRMRRS